MKKAVVFTITSDTEEIRSLLDTLEIVIAKEFLQKMSAPHKTSYLGPGKIEEVAKQMKDLEVDIIVVNGLLKPSQHHYLEMKFQMECIDRSGVILRIFSDHAHTPEAIAQVTLAKLRYELPFLREWIHKAKSGDRPGFLAGGTYATDVYFEHAKTHARRIEENLKDLSKQREITRTKRRAKGYSLISLAGYTNAGKSALLNRMCGSDVEVDDRLFSTLSTTTRRLKGTKSNILMSDTVGFIRDLPPNLINAFNSTLEEIFYADLILLMFDVSEEEDVMRGKLSTSFNILQPRIENRSLIIVANKADLMPPNKKEAVESIVESVTKTHELYVVSAKTGIGIDKLHERILRTQNYTCHVSAYAPLTDQAFSLLSRLRSIAEVTEDQEGSLIQVDIKCKPGDVEKIVGWLGAAGAVKILSRCEASEEAPEGGTPSTGNEGPPL
jgi:GTP-binding protein HflX